MTKHACFYQYLPASKAEEPHGTSSIQCLLVCKYPDGWAFRIDFIAWAKKIALHIAFDARKMHADVQGKNNERREE